MNHITTFAHTIPGAVLTRSLAVVTALIISVTCGHAQTSATDGTTPAALAAGAPAGSYSLSDFERINLFNGNLNANFRVLQIGGRGRAGYSMTLPIEQHWRTVNGAFTDSLGNIWNYSYAEANWWDGLKPGYSPGVLQSRTAASDPGNCDPTIYGGEFNGKVLTRLTFTSPDATEYELVDALTNGAPHFFGQCGSQTFSRGRVFVSHDGADLTFIADQPVTENNTTWGIGALSGVLMFPDGSQYRVDGGLVTSIRDRNGSTVRLTYGMDPANALTYQRLTNLTDSLNRQVSISYADNSTVFYDQIGFKGFGGAQRTVRVWHSSLGQALRAGYSLSNYYHVFPEYATNSFPPDPNDPNLYNPTVVSSLELPDGRRIQFLYNPYSELARVVLPTGGAVEYDHTPTSGVICYNPNECGSGSEIYRRTVERRVYSDSNSTPESRTTYSSLTTSGGFASDNPVTVDHWNSVGMLLAREQHYYFGNAVPSSSLFPIFWSPWNSGKEYQTEGVSVVSGVAGGVLRRNTYTWQQRAPVSWCTTQMGCTQDGAPANDPRIVETVTTLLDTNQVSKTTAINPQTGTVGFDQFNNPTDSWEYDYGVGTPGSLLRHVHTEYLTINPQNGVDYTNRNSVSSPHLLNLTARQSVFDPAEVERARTAYEYDDYVADGNHAGLVDRPGISGMDSAFTTGYLTRGNVSGTTRYLLANGSITGSISAFAQYDIAGNVVKTIDGRGNAGTFDFTDRFGAPDGEARSNSAPLELSSVGQASYAFPTLVTNALGHTAYAQFDFYLGRPVNGEDPNGIVSSGFYNDVLDRPTQVIRAVNDLATKNQTTFSYDDLNHTITTTSDQTSFNDPNPLKSQVLYDGLGRTTETRQFEGGANYIALQTQYDARSRAFKTSNPFRPWNLESPIWTTAGFDALGRVISVTTPDSAVVTTSYSGNTVTVTDQAGKQRKSITDALGRLLQVYEAPNDPNFNYLTSYSYDTLNNLTTVNQGSQTRSFAYDSLKRLTSAVNPESGTAGYQYDENGNLRVKTDARGVSAHFSYDALNRMTRRWYNGSSSLDQVANNVPALPSSVVTSDEVAYFYDSQSLPPGAPPGFSPGYSIGRLVATVYGTGSSAGDYHGYDAAGRPVLKIQQTGGVNYPVSAIYNLSGAITTETYPSGRTVTYGYDGAGRTISFAGNLGDATQRTYSTGIIYSPFGGLAKEQFGTATPVYNKLFYNSRGQLSEIRESTSYTGPTDTNWNRGAIINDYSNNCTGICSGQSMADNNGNLKKQENYIPDNDQISTYSAFTAAFTYDSLNRLQAANESKYLNGSLNGTPTYSQSYTIDRWGNRTINQATGGVNGLPFNVDPSTNRLTPPSGYTMTYDSVGNLTNDTYTGQGQRNYDAENRMTQAWASGQWQSYTYDGNGQRVRRNADGTETWQVYGLGGELLAEYAANANFASPLKEYGYRNGQLLIMATAPSGLAANTASDTNSRAVAAASPVSGKESTAAAQSFDLLASVKGLILRSSGISTITSASTEAVSDTSTPLFGPSFSYAASLNRSAIPLMPQSGSAKIAFASNRDGSAQIYSMNTDGSGLSRLTNDAANDEAPDWSPNNSRIVFQSDRDNLFSGSADIYVMNWDGSGQTRLTSAANDDSAPVWSPDGTKIAFQSARNGVSYQVYVMNADGSAQVNIRNSAANDNQPSWSPDGSKIAFASDRDQAGCSSIYVMNANGTNQMRLTTSGVGVLDQQPVWSPDGTKLTFTSTRDSIVQTWQETDDNGGIVTKSALHVNKEVYVMNANGSAQMRLTNTLENDDSASWSGDGTKIVFRSDRERECCDPTEQVWVMNPDGTSQVDLSNNGLDDHCPSWQHAANVPPTVSLTSPANGATFIAPANITLTATASDSDGSVSRVDFYQGVTLIGTSTTSPYTISWNNVGAGGYTLTARAADNLGASTTSNSISITVGSPPTVSVTTPANGASFTAPANITLTANASSSNGSIGRVEFYQGTTLIGTASTSPYTISWNNVAAGSWTLKARAIDNSNVSTDSTPVNISVNAPPTVSLTSPTNGASFNAPANVTITANANDSDGTVSRVDFYQGTTLIGTATASPYNISWNNVTAGTYSLTAKATDNLGAQTISTAVNATVITPVADIRWIVTDQLGTPRMIFDQTGSLASVSRHDYLPFGEELTAGGRTTALGYGVGDGAREKFTSEERDTETGLDYFINRYYSSAQGRFTSPDIFGSRKRNPQSWNRYSYVLNNPLRYIDPLGLDPQDPTNKIAPEDVIRIVIHDKPPSLLKRIFGKIGSLFKGGSRVQSEGEEEEERESEETREEERKADEKDLNEQSPWRDPNGVPPVKTDPDTIVPGLEDPSEAREMEEASLVPELKGKTSPERLKDAIARVASSEGSPEAKAELMVRFAHQIRVRSEFEWGFWTARGTDGSQIIFGPGGIPGRTNLIVISPQGGVYTGNTSTGVTISPNSVTPIYNQLIRR